MDAYNSLGYEIAETHKSLKAKFQKVLKPHGLTVQQFEVMRTLRKGSGKSAAQLVKSIISDSSTMMVILKTLESKKLIIRKSHEKDLRTKRIYLTKKGQDLVEDLMVYADLFNARIKDCISVKELQAMKKILLKLRAFSKTDQDLK